MLEVYTVTVLENGGNSGENLFVSFSCATGKKGLINTGTSWSWDLWLDPEAL